jgi:hypothetical protein
MLSATEDHSVSAAAAGNTEGAEQLWSRSWLNLVKGKSLKRLDRLRALAENPSRLRPRRYHAL